MRTEEEIKEMAEKEFPDKEPYPTRSARSCKRIGFVVGFKACQDEKKVDVEQLRVLAGEYLDEYNKDVSETGLLEVQVSDLDRPQIISFMAHFAEKHLQPQQPDKPLVLKTTPSELTPEQILEFEKSIEKMHKQPMTIVPVESDALDFLRYIYDNCSGYTDTDVDWEWYHWQTEKSLNPEQLYKEFRNRKK